MKKLFSALLMAVLLVSMTTTVFAAGPKSPVQPTPPPVPSDTGDGEVPAGKQPVIAGVEILAEEDIVFDKDCDASAGADSLDEVDEETQEAVKALADRKEAAVKALTPKNIGAAISSELLKKADGKSATCTNPQEMWCRNGDYPCFVKYTVDQHVDTVLLFIDGAWTVPGDLELVENKDGSCTVSFTLEAPALYTDIWFK